jgi:hypothetical protein
MSCNIHARAERQNPDGTVEYLGPVFDLQSYALFGFLADVRNYAAVPTLVSKRRGIPCDAVPAFGCDKYSQDGGHSHSWLSLKELTDFDYDAKFENRRCTVEGDGGCTCEIGSGHMIAFRDEFPKLFFDDLARMVKLGATRVVFWFNG